MLMSHPTIVVHDHRTWWRSFIFQAIVCLFIGTILPPAIYFHFDFQVLGKNIPTLNSVIASLFAASGGLFLARKVNSYPGVKQLGSAAPGFALSFGFVSLVILATRVNYSGAILVINFVSSLTVYLLLMALGIRSDPNVFYNVPGGRIERLAEFGIDSIPLTEPILPVGRGVIVVADLHCDMPAPWERMLAQAALKGVPVFHYKQIYEAATGKVQVEHLSENSLGSLLPDMHYARVKRTIDALIALALLPLLIIPFAFVAVAIKLDSRGPVFFRQERIGYRGKTFRVAKFRTMYCAEDQAISADQRFVAMTCQNDSRITRIGSFLRRTRIDELPQIINVLGGEMSWIGPRPEALTLSKWYEVEIPFYSYRHIVRPGLTGWAQVNQGHVTELQDIDKKLQYDFFYIKNYSYWLDILITFKTVAVILSGSGAK